MSRLCVLLLLLGVVCCGGCREDNRVGVDACPQLLLDGDRCEAAGQECPFPQARCDTTLCSCEDRPGGPRWKCRVETCSCVCGCGRVVVTTCEAVECRSVPDSCPAIAADRCAIVCPDGGPADLGVEGVVVDATREDGTQIIGADADGTEAGVPDHGSTDRSTGRTIDQGLGDGTSDSHLDAGGDSSGLVDGSADR